VELSGKKFNIPRVSGLPSSRRGAVVLAVACAVAAGVIVLVALSHYRQSVSLANKQETVLVATGTIQRGTSGDLVAQERLYKPTPVLSKDIAAGAITNAAALHGEVASQQILPGQQLTAGDFAASTGSLVGELARTQRAVSLALDPQHGLVGELEAGDRVDVYADFTGSGNPSGSGGSGAVVKLLIPDAVVLKTPAASGGLTGGITGTVVLAVGENQVGALAYAAENGKVWLALRPGGAASSSSGLTTFNSVLFGTGGKS
jgi:pilus assembly protein CpaB